MKIGIHFLLFLLTAAGCSASSRGETPTQNLAEAIDAKIVVPETFFEPLTRAVIQAYLYSNMHVSDKYWWLDCPKLEFHIDDVLSKEEIKSVQQCMKEDTHRQFALELRRATKLGGYHYGRPVWGEVEAALSQYDSLEHLFASTRKFYWRCEAVDIQSDGVIPDFKGERTFEHVPSESANPGELYDCVFPLYTQRPIYTRILMLGELASLLNLHNVTQPTLFNWTVRVFSPDRQSPLKLIDSSVMGDESRSR